MTRALDDLGWGPFFADQVTDDDAGLVPMRIVTAHGTTTATNAPFTYVPLPGVTGLTFRTSSTAGGATVTIGGKNFYHAASVYFGSTAARFTPLSINYIRAVVPPHAAGPVDVDRAARAARAAFRRGAWRRLAPSVQTRFMLALADLIDRDAELLRLMGALACAR